MENFDRSSSGFNETLWNDSASRPQFPELNSHINTETVIVGAGIAGLSIAYCLAKAGRKVVVIEDGQICSGAGQTRRI